MWDGDPECQHEWHTKTWSKSTNYNEGFNQRWEGSPNRIQKQSEMGKIRDVTTGFCTHCGAWLGCLGLEPTPELFVDHLVQIFREVKRVLRGDGTLWLNIGDSYAGKPGGYYPCGDFDSPSKKEQRGERKVRMSQGLKPKDMVMIPFRLALALQADGWWVRSDIIWHKPNCMPSSVKDRPTTDFEHVFLLAKSKRYYYDQDAIREPMSEATRARDEYGFSGAFKGQFNGTPDEKRWQDGRPIDAPKFYNEKGRNKRTVWTVNTKPYKGAHFATFPPKLIEPMILAGSKEGDIVFDPFAGSGTVCAEAKKWGRHWVGIEANPEYCELAEERICIEQTQLKLDLWWEVTHALKNSGTEV